MKHILNFYVHATPKEGNELKWVGTARKGSYYEIRRSTDEINFENIHTIENPALDAEVFEFTDFSDAPATFYQIAYLEKDSEVQLSQVEGIEKKRQFNWVLFAVRLVVAIALVLLAVFMMQRFMGSKPAPMNRSFTPALPAAKVVDVSYKNFNTKIEALGQVISTQPIDIIAEVSGKILKGDVALRKAGTFNANALLFAIEKEEAILNLKSQRSNFLNALVQMLPDLKLDFPDEFDKWNNYFQGIDVNRTLTPLPSINGEREKTFVATKNILGQYYSIKSAEKRLSKYEVRAPYSGTITEVYTDVGSVANLGTRVVRVMRNDQLELELPIRKEDIRWIKVGSTVKLFSEDKKQSASGRVARISKTIDPATQSVSVYISINARGIRLYEGMYLAAELAGRTLTNAMEMDRKAVFDNNKVFVMQSDSTITERTITIQKVNTETFLFSGLKEGEKVVNDNLLGLADGIKIKPL